MTRSDDKKEGWIRFEAHKPIANFAALLKKYGGEVVKVHVKSSGRVQYYVYFQKCFDAKEGFTYINKVNHLLFSTMLTNGLNHDTFRVKPWELMNEEERQIANDLEGHVFTERETWQNGECANLVLVISRVEHKKKDLVPTYECFRIEISKYGDRIHTRSRKMQLNLYEIMKDKREEGDLSFLVVYGAPGQLVVNQIQEKIAKLEKQISDWKNALGKLGVLNGSK